MAKGFPDRNVDRRQAKLGYHSRDVTAVTRCFEEALGLKPEAESTLDWLIEVVQIFNRKNGTNIQYDHEDYGYWFTYSSLEDLEALEKLHSIF